MQVHSNRIMSAYWVKTPIWFKRLYPGTLIWDIREGKADGSVYLTFDDGPHPEITPFVLNTLKAYNAHATFFCVGNNVRLYPDTYRQILDAGHSMGNHTYDHLNGWRTEPHQYLSNITKAAGLISSPLFRPPYGRIRYSQLRKLRETNPDYKVIMWSLLSGDFDRNITPQQCLDNVLHHLQPGSIVVFHDSVKARERLEYTLPRVLDYCKQHNLTPRAISMI